MRLVIFGGNGLIGSKLVSILSERGHDVVPASRSSGLDILTGQGLDQALQGAQVLVDVTNSPSFADADVLSFFQTSTRNLLRAAKTAGVGHYVALSVVGADRVPDSGYLRAKAAQETLIRSGGVPYTILRATQFFEFLPAIAGSGAGGGQVRLPRAQMQPIAAADVSLALGDIALSPPINGVIEVAGPERLPMDQLVRRYLEATGDPRTVISDDQARYFGARLDDRSITPGDNPRLGAVRFAQWLAAARTPVA